MEKLAEVKEYPFEFSVVMAVYNVEPFLREAVDSLIAQDFGFEHIQLIMVDDGSTDSSGAICDEYAAQYPENVQVVHKENGGVASARNTGLKYAKGRYLNFMDSDDKFTVNAFSRVYNFFVKNEEETDLVTIPLEFFDAQHGGHWQNYKFKRGTRLLDLYWDYQATIMFVNASFFAHHLKDEIVFDGHLVCGEDIKVLLTILVHKMKMGVVTGCKYMYRKSSTNLGLVQTAKNKYGWYFDYFTYLVDWAVAFYQNCFGYLPAFLQYELLADLQWRFKENYDMTSVLSEAEIEEYKQRLFRTLTYFEDKYFLDQKMLGNEHKCYMLSKKYGYAPSVTERHSNVIVHFGDTKISSLADMYSKIDFLSIKNGKFIIEGYTKIFGINENTPIDIFIQVNDELIACEMLERAKVSDYRLGELIYRGLAFRAVLPLDKNNEEYCIKLVVKYQNSYVVKRKINYGLFCAVGNEYSNSYYYIDNWLMQIKGNSIVINKCGRKGRFNREKKFLKELWQKNRPGARKAVLARLVYPLAKLFYRKPIWLISDRPGLADDNGEAFFNYVIQKHKGEKNFYFALNPESADYTRLKKKGKVVPFLGWRYKFLYLLAENIISSQGEHYIFRPYQNVSAPYRDLSLKQKFIFLQHGVIKDDLSDWLNRYNKNISMFVTTTNPEYQSILSYPYYYSENVVKKTGLPRYDRLYHNEKKQVVVMPTWRAYLVTDVNPLTGGREVKPGFDKSKYCQMYNNLLNNERLLNAAKKYGYTVAFVNHPNMLCSDEFMSFSDEVKIVPSDYAYRDIFAESNLLITDYSSVAFDFAYLRKPVLYYQADVDEFFSGIHTYEKGYFDYERDGFGEVEYDAEPLVDRIIEYMQNDCQLNEKYRRRIEATFPFNDQNNCQRVYETILALDK